MAGASRRAHGPDPFACGAPVVLECYLLLPAEQAEGLFRVAAARGATAGQLVRRLIGEFLARVGPGVRRWGSWAGGRRPTSGSGGPALRS
jgi:hypothetical protein